MPLFKLDHLLARLFVGISPRIIMSLGNKLGAILFFIDVPHRRIVRRNLKFAYPEWTLKHVKQVSKEVFQNITTTVIEMWQMYFFSKGDMLDKARYSGEEHFKRAYNENRGVIIISAHMGNWEMIPMISPQVLKKPISVVVRKLRFEPVEKRITSIRTRFGSKMVNMKDAMPELIKALRCGEVLGLMVDQDLRSSISVKVDFFQHSVAATHAAALLALRCKAPVVPMFCNRAKNGRLKVRLEPALELQRTNDLRADIQVNTQMITGAIEKAVRSNPGQWLWAHKRWKKYYPNLYYESIRRRRRRRARKIIKENKK